MTDLKIHSDKSVHNLKLNY